MFTYSLLDKVAQLDLSKVPLPHANTSPNGLQPILSVVFSVIGAIAFLVITIAGFRYITAQDDPQKVAQARRAILYAVIGLVIAASGQLIVTFVLGNVS